MFANLVRLALAVELAAWLLLAGLVAARTGIGMPAAVALAAALAVVARLAFVMASFGLSWLSRSPRAPGERLGVAGTLALVAGEWRSVLANNFLWLPLDRVVMGRDPPLGPDSRVPVILVHGYFSNRGTLCALSRVLREAGIGPVFAPSLPAVIAPIETFASHLGRRIREVTEATGQPRVVLVCHSMGGLAARACLRSGAAPSVAGIVTIGSPHHGSALAVLGAGENARQMRPGSAFLEGLERAEGGAGPGCQALSVYSVHDNLVAPQESSRLPWARHVVVHGVGHLAMLSDARVHRAVRMELERLGARTAA